MEYKVEKEAMLGRGIKLLRIIEEVIQKPGGGFTFDKSEREEEVHVDGQRFGSVAGVGFLGDILDAAL